MAGLGTKEKPPTLERGSESPLASVTERAFDLTRYGFETLFLFPLKGKRGKTGDRGLRGMTGEKVSTESRPQENLTRLHIADAIRKTERLTFNTMLIYLPL